MPKPRFLFSWTIHEVRLDDMLMETHPLFWVQKWVHKDIPTILELKMDAERLKPFF